MVVESLDDHLRSAECADPLDRVVGRGVVDHDHLDGGAVDLQERLDDAETVALALCIGMTTDRSGGLVTIGALLITAGDADDSTERRTMLAARLRTSAGDLHGLESSTGGRSSWGDVGIRSTSETRMPVLTIREIFDTARAAGFSERRPSPGPRSPWPSPAVGPVS